MVGEDEHRRAKRRVRRPAHLAFLEHALAHHVGPGPGEHGPHERVVPVDVAAGHPHALPEAGQRAHPLMDPQAAVPEGVPGTPVRSRDEAVQRHPDVHEHLPHR
jgi:hypothetical protein